MYLSVCQAWCKYGYLLVQLLARTLVSMKIVDGCKEGVSGKVILDDNLFLVRSREGIVATFVHAVNDIHRLLLHKKIAARPHAVKATKIMSEKPVILLPWP